MDNNTCIFCKIINNELPSHKIYEDDKFLAFLDIEPLNPGHTLLIPKKHVKWVNDYEPFDEYWQTARKLSMRIKEKLNAIVVSYVVYGLGVAHAHIHLIPKFEGDAHPHGPNPEHKITYAPGEAEKIIEKINLT